MSDEERLDSQSDRAIEAWNNANWEGHGVNLERVQRIFLGLDSEPMEFDENSIAGMLEAIARETLPEHGFTLFAIVEALRGNDDHHVLQLKQKRPGKWENPTEFEDRYNREMKWLWSLGSWEHQGIKTEAAVARIAEIESVSRASVFAGVRRAEKFLDDCWSIRGETRFGPRPRHLTNPRPAKKRNT